MSIKIRASCSEEYELYWLAERLKVKSEDFDISKTLKKSKFKRAYITIENIPENAGSITKCIDFD